MSTAIREQCDSANVEFVRCLCVTSDGLIRGQAVHTDHLEEALAEGIPFAKMTQSFNAIGHRVKDATFDAVGEVRLQPDPSTFRVLPHEERTATVLCDLLTHDTKTPWAGDPRAAVQRQLTSCDIEGLTPALAIEQEFHLYAESADGTPTPLDPRGAYASASMRASSGIILDIVDALIKQGIDVQKHHPEYTAGKNEIVVGHGRGLTPIDNAIFCRETVAGVAENAGANATFSPYPFDGATNGCHIHCSLWDGDENVFAPSSSDDALSQRGRWFVGGLIDHMPALLALTAPTVNSYARLQPAKSVCAFNCWGVGNREAAIRIPEVRPSNHNSRTRIEFRPADNAANPYLAVCGVLAAGIDGIERQLDCGPSLEQDPGNLDLATRRDREIEQLPRSLGTAIRELETDAVLRGALGEPLLQSYLEIKRSEWDAFLAHADTWKRETYRNRY
ncbi:glutamine synthetase family protein [Halocatena halophila]|uniref:glutamine synthetase family protein n=1 Tax=Halocatena halophila TaxID=2814576 RepID=UPI002ED03963